MSIRGMGRPVGRTVRDYERNQGAGGSPIGRDAGEIARAGKLRAAEKKWAGAMKGLTYANGGGTIDSARASEKR